MADTIVTVNIHAKTANTDNGWIPAPVAKQSPVLNYDADLNTTLSLLNFPNVFIYDASSNQIINKNNLQTYYPEYNPGGGGGGGTTDYLDLSNKPQINGHELVGDLSPEDLGIQQVQVDWNETAPSAVSYIKNKPEIPAILYGTTESWNSQASLVSQQKTIYVYTDYQVHEGKNIPGFKVGDGITLLINLPFTSSGGGVTDSERESWNNKVTAFIDPKYEKNLIFSKD
jgi:hypothetical protein